MAQLGNVGTLAIQLPISALDPVFPDIESLFERQPAERFHAGETIFFEGDPAKHVFEVTEGVVRLSKILVDGRRIVGGFLFAGDVVGVSQRHRFAYSAEAVTGVKLRRVSRLALDKAMDGSSELRAQIFAKLCMEMAAAQEQMALLSCKTAEERVATFLVTLMKRSPLRQRAPMVIDLPMTRLDMADHLGLTIETISRNLTKLAKLGVIGNVERFTLRIIRPQALEEIAGTEDDQADYAVSTPRRGEPAYRH